MSIRIILWNIAMTPNPPPNINMRQSKERAPKIAKILNEYDIVILNESFLYRDYLLKNVVHKYKYTDPRTWYKIFNSGVVILSKIPITNFNYIHYRKGATWDWFVSKGLVGVSFQYNGTIFNLHGTHLQAGNSNSAHNARYSQICDIIDYINNKYTKKEEVIICGDFNCGPVFDPEYKNYPPYYSNSKDAKRRDEQYRKLVYGLRMKPLYEREQDNNISGFIHSGIYSNIKRIKDPKIQDEEGVSLSDTAPLCIEISLF